MNEVQRRTVWLLLLVLALAFAACVSLAAQAETPQMVQVKNAISGSGVLASGAIARVNGAVFTAIPASGDYANPPDTLQGIRVLVAGQAARLRYLGIEYIDFIVPDCPFGWNRVEVEREGVPRWRAWVCIASTSPALFTEYGSAQGIAWNGVLPVMLCAPELKLNCQPPQAARELGIQLWGTGWRNAHRVWVLIGERWIAAQVSRQELIAPGNNTLTFTLPPGLAGKLRVRVWADGRISNEASVWVMGAGD